MPRLLDLFCAAGGAATGYHRAGFEVVGVDHKPQPRYPFEFHQADALEFCREHGHEFDAIHASPPCQRYSSVTATPLAHPDLYDNTRTALVATEVPYVIENVIGAPYQSGIVLCGSMLGLVADGEWLRRHRNFETSWLIFQPECRHPRSRPVMVTSNSYVSETRDYSHSRQGTFALAQQLMGIDWMTRDELAQAIPPAYSQFVGEQLLDYLAAQPRKETSCSIF